MLHRVVMMNGYAWVLTVRVGDVMTKVVVSTIDVWSETFGWGGEKRDISIHHIMMEYTGVHSIAHLYKRIANHPR